MSTTTMYTPPQEANRSNLKQGIFLLPATQYLESASEQIELSNDKRLQKSINSMKSILYNSNLKNIADLLPKNSDLTLPAQLETLAEKISNDIQKQNANPRDEDLINIFHMIQLWGGIGGRTIYTKGSGFEENFDIRAYRDFTEVACSEAPEIEKVAHLETLAEKIKFFGVSFATKHAKFWSENIGEKTLLIYDSVISAGCFGYKIPQWRHYAHYLTEMQSHARKLDTTPLKLERALFNFFTSPDGQRWVQARNSQVPTTRPK